MCWKNKTTLQEGLKNLESGEGHTTREHLEGAAELLQERGCMQRLVTLTTPTGCEG